MEMDPENGIEEQYKSKHNKVYVWKAYRLIARENMSLFFHKLRGGNINAPDNLDALVAQPSAKTATIDLTSSASKTAL